MVCEIDQNVKGLLRVVTSTENRIEKIEQKQQIDQQQSDLIQQDTNQKLEELQKDMIQIKERLNFFEKGVKEGFEKSFK